MPSEVTTADKANEIFRGWVIDERLCCLIRPLIWQEDPETWGIFLADALAHIGNAIHTQCHTYAVPYIRSAIHTETGQNTEELKELILQRFNTEIAATTDIHESNFYDE